MGTANLPPYNNVKYMLTKTQLSITASNSLEFIDMECPTNKHLHMLQLHRLMISQKYHHILVHN